MHSVRAAVLNCRVQQNHLEGLLKHRLLTATPNPTISNSVGFNGGLRICISSKVFGKSSPAGLRTANIESMLCEGLGKFCGDFEDTKSCLANGQISPCFTSLIDKEEIISTLTF